MNNFYRTNIEKKTIKNKNYRKVLYTTKQLQLVIMNLLPFEEIGKEKHKKTTQFIRVEKGNGTAIVGNKRCYLKDGISIIIPAKKYHNIIAGRKGLKLYTIYSPPEHPKNTVEKRKK